jgi:hypothetical protein
MPVGYSGTPLVKKLGIAEGMRVAVLDAPEGYLELLGVLPDGVRVDADLTELPDLVHVFVLERPHLAATLAALRKRIDGATPVWVSWPKKSSKVATTVTEDVIRDVALPLGFVDVKVCAVSEVWSGLKLVVRKELRARKAR